MKMMKIWLASVLALMTAKPAWAVDYWWVGADETKGMSFYLDVDSLTRSRSRAQGLIVQVFAGARRDTQSYAYNRDQVVFGCADHSLAVLNQISFRQNGQIERSDVVNQTLLVDEATPAGHLWLLACGLASATQRRTFVDVGTAEPGTVDDFVESAHSSSAPRQP